MSPNSYCPSITKRRNFLNPFPSSRIEDLRTLEDCLYLSNWWAMTICDLYEDLMRELTVRRWPKKLESEYRESHFTVTVGVCSHPTNILPDWVVLYWAVCNCLVIFSMLRELRTHTRLPGCIEYCNHFSWMWVLTWMYLCGNNFFAPFCHSPFTWSRNFHRQFLCRIF